MLKRANETKKSSQMSPPVLRSAAPTEPIISGWNVPMDDDWAGDPCRWPHAGQRDKETLKKQ